VPDQGHFRLKDARRVAREADDGTEGQNKCRLDSLRFSNRRHYHHRHERAFATVAILQSGFAERKEDREARARTFERRSLRRAINYRLISHNYWSSQTSGMPERLSMQVCIENRLLRKTLATKKKSSPLLIMIFPTKNSSDNSFLSLQFEQISSLSLNRKNSFQFFM